MQQCTGDALDEHALAGAVVAQDPGEIGRSAAQLAFARIDNPELPTAVHIVFSVLVTRGSGEIPPGR